MPRPLGSNRASGVSRRWMRAAVRRSAVLVSVTALVVTTALLPTADAAEPESALTAESSAPVSTDPTGTANDTAAPTVSTTDESSTADATSSATSTSTSESTAESSVATTGTQSPVALAASSVLGAPNPFDATHGFTVLVRGDATIDGAVAGSVAVGGAADLGTARVASDPSASIDGTPIGLLTGGAATGDGSAEVAAGQVLVGDLGGLEARATDAGIALFPAGSDQPLITGAAAQDPTRVTAPGLFPQAFGVFDDLARRSTVLAAQAATVEPTDADGNPLTDLSGADVHLALRDGANFWTVDAATLGTIGSLSVSPAPSVASPLVVTVTGESATLGTAGLDAADAGSILWNLPETTTVTVEKPTVGSVLATSATVEVAADVTGSVVAASFTQNSGTTVTAAAFGAELPTEAADSTPTETSDSTGTTEPTESTEPTETADPPTAMQRLIVAAQQPTADDDLVSVLAVPPATGNNAVITVKVGGVRTALNTVGNLAGVVIGLYTDQAGTIPATGTGNPVTCTSDAAGDCSFIIANTQAGPPAGANRDKRYWIKQISAPAGWFMNQTLGTGTTVASDSYVFQTGEQLRAGSTYSSTTDFMIATGNTNNEASGGIWQNSLNNPTAPTKCGINVALVLDLSSSVGTDLVNLKAAAKTFTSALQGTPSQVGLFTFASAAPAAGSANVTRPLTPVSTAAGVNTVNGWIDGLTLPGGQDGGTNWDRGFFQVAQSTSAFDVTVIITDGNPTFYGNAEGPGSRTRFREVENGIFSANAIKSKAAPSGGNTRVIAFGVGSGVGNAASGLNLKAISGPTLNSDYYQTTDYAAAGNQLKALAQGTCQGSLTVIKEVIPSTTTPPALTGATPAGGWTFGTVATGGVTVNPASGVTATGTGAVNFALTFPTGITATTAAVTETQQSGYTLQQVSAANAVCTRTDTGAALPVTNSGGTGFTVTASKDYPTSCIVYNRAPNPAADITVNKFWNVNGTTYPDGQQPSDLIAALTLNNTAQPWGSTRTGFSQGSVVAINETTTNNLPLCTISSRLLTKANGTTVSQALPYNATLNAGSNTYEITNTVTCTSTLRLVKTTNGGPAALTAWTLNAAAPTGALAGPTGTTGVTATVTPGARYTLSESTGDPRYIQQADPNAVPISGSTVSWVCQQVDASGNVIPGFSDGLNGGVTMPIGVRIQCTAMNLTTKITMIKQVVNDNGGTATPADFQLTATPVAPVFPGLTATTVAGSTTGTEIWVRPGQAYQLSETGPPGGGYQQTGYNCVITGVGTRADQTITLTENEEAVCTFTNDDQPAQLTLTKIVNNGTTGGTAVPANWTLTGTVPTTISGASGSAAVTNATVNAGTYTLTESGPSGYIPGSWSCTGATVSGTQVTVPVGGIVSCSITNTAQQTRLTLRSPTTTAAPLRPGSGR